VDKLVDNNIFLLYMVTLLYVAIAGIKMNERARIALVYIFSVILAIVTLPAILAILGATVVLFIYLEVLCEDRMKLWLFTGVRYKITDFLYRLFVEYYYLYFLLALLILVPEVTLPAAVKAGGAVFWCAAAVLRLMAQTYATKSVTAIVQALEAKMPIYKLEITPDISEKFAILLRMEDITYYTRDDSQHAWALRAVLRKGFRYLKQHKGMGLVKGARALLSRGYGTIEMQLIRCIGIESGYDHRYRRKVFEYLYANMIFNSYRTYLQQHGIDPGHYREFILWQYIQHVPIQLNGRHEYEGETSTLLRLFHKTDIRHITNEEFFIWCLGLPQWQSVGPLVVGWYAPVMQEFGINKQSVLNRLRRMQD